MKKFLSILSCRAAALSPEGHFIARSAFILLLWLGGGGVLSAQNGVSLSGLSVSAGTVTFEVSWDKNKVPPVWSDSVWVFVDYNNKGVMERLPLSAGATLTATSAPGVGRVKEEPGNNKGVWVIGNARTAGVFSASVKLLTATVEIAGACVYASNYPPVGVFVHEGGVSFTGTPMYDLIFRDSNRKQQNWSISGGSYTVPGSFTLVSFSDRTGAPGKIITHAVYCFPGVIGGTGDAPPGCAVYRAGSIGGSDDTLPDCAAYVAGTIGGQDDAFPDCAVYRAGSIGGSDDTLSDCVVYRAGSIGGSDATLSDCAVYRAGSIGGVSFAGLM